MRVEPGSFLLAAALLAAGCGAGAAPADAPGPPGARVAIAIAPLDLPLVADADYRLTVVNGDSPPETVWVREISASAWGDGRGSISYVGPCDATPPTNRVTVEILALYSASGAVLSDWIDPGPLSQDVTCTASADVAVTFDITLARRANQGFFDVAVSFDDLFCSAKLDCVDALLHHDGVRDATVVVAFACTTGAGTPTFLHLDDIVIGCSDGSATTVHPTAGPGNTGQSGAHVFQVATYRGREGFASFDKCYWNTAIGLDTASFAGDTTTDCTLTARASASQAAWPTGQPPAGATWPWIGWSVPVVTDGVRVCGAHALDAPGSGVTTEYVAPGAAPPTFSGSLDCAACGGTACPATSHDFACGGALAGFAAPVSFRNTEAGLVVTVDGVESDPMPFPEGYGVAGCCLDPCCAQ